MLHYHKSRLGNFGDDLNPWLWSRIAPELVAPEDPRVFVGIGTLLSHSLPREPVKFVLGAGCGYSRLPRVDERFRFYAVRGPLTVARLGLDPDLSVGDPAILVRRFAGCASAPRRGVAFMPHHVSLRYADWPRLCRESSLRLIDPRGTVEEVLEGIGASELVLAEAMHGAIVADALRVPWIPVRLYSQFLEFKWRDWAQALGLALDVREVPPVFERPPSGLARLVHPSKAALARVGLGKAKWLRLQQRASTPSEVRATLAGLEQLGELGRAGRGTLSSDAALARVEECLLASLDRLRSDWRAGA